MEDLISRKKAIDEIEYELEMMNSALDSITLDFETRGRLRQRIGEAREILNSIQQLPSVQPEHCEDAVSRQMVSEWLKQYGQDVLHGKYKFSLMYIWKNLMELPSVQTEQPEITEIIRCKDCKQFRRWIDTDICFCDITESEISDNDFCSRAERITDE